MLLHQGYTAGGGVRKGLGSFGIEGIGGILTIGTVGISGIGGTLTTGIVGTVGIGGIVTTGIVGSVGIGGAASVGIDGNDGIGGTVAGMVGTTDGVGGSVGSAGTARASVSVSNRCRAAWHAALLARTIATRMLRARRPAEAIALLKPLCAARSTEKFNGSYPRLLD